jgi:Xaa-Pro dipeptidase
MEAENLDVLVLGLPKNVPLLSGFWPMIGASNLIFPVQKNPVCIIPDCYEKEAISSFWEAEAVYYQYGVLGAPAPQSAVQNILTGIAEGKSWKPIGFEGSFDLVAPSWNTAEFLVPPAQNREFLRTTTFQRRQLIHASCLLETNAYEKRPTASVRYARQARSPVSGCRHLRAGGNRSFRS